VKIAEALSVAFDLHSVIRLIRRCANLELKNSNDAGSYNDCIKTFGESKEWDFQE
jgi:hypothetical protein